MIKKPTRWHVPLATVLLSCAILAACIDSDDYDIEGVTATPSVTLPLAFGDLSIADFLRESDSRYIKVDQDGLMYLAYEQELESQDVSGLLTFPDKAFNQQAPFPAKIVGANDPGETYPTLETSLDFGFDPEKLSQMIMKSGSLFVNTSASPINPNFQYEIRVDLPSFTKNGITFSEIFTPGTRTVDLQDYQANFVNNVTPIRITITRKATTNAYALTGGFINVALQFGNFEYKLVKGFFGDQTAQLPPQTIKIDSFNPVDQGTVSFADPQLSFEVVNRYGIPVNVNFVTLEARKQGSTKAINLDKTNPIAVGFPTVVGDSAKTTVSVTNAQEIYTFNPDELYYNVNARINEGLVNGNNFTEDKSNLVVRFKARVPMYGKASGIILSDTTDLGIGDIESSEVEQMFLKGHVINQLPLDAYLQLYLANENSIITDSIFTKAQAEDIVKPSSVNAQGELVKAGEYNEEIALDKAKVQKILKAEKLIIMVRLRTVTNPDKSQPDVKFKADYKMNVKFGLRANLTVNADL